MNLFGFVGKHARKYAGPLLATVLSMSLLVGLQLVSPWMTLLKELGFHRRARPVPSRQAG